MQRIFISALFLLVTTVACSKNTAKNFEYINVDNWQSINSDLNSNKLSAKQTLIILDDDNTLLQTAGYIGSPEWFSNQYTAICNNAKSKIKPIVKNCDDFLALNNFVLSVVPKKLVDNSIPNIIKKWQAAGYTVMIVTSRTPAVRFSTLRGLAVHGIYINNNLYASSKVANAPKGNHVLFLDKAHKHAYMHGILFATGYDKAKLVADLFATAKPVKDFKNYIVVDDTDKNLNDFREWFKQQHKVNGLYLYHYNKEPRYSDEQKKASAEKLNSAIQVLNAEFGDKNRVY